MAVAALADSAATFEWLLSQFSLMWLLWQLLLTCKLWLTRQLLLMWQLWWL
jgi:hypothetical protein